MEVFEIKAHKSKVIVVNEKSPRCQITLYDEKLKQRSEF